MRRRLGGVADEQAAVGVDHRGGFGDGLQHAGLVVGRLKRDQRRRRAGRAASRASRSITPSEPHGGDGRLGKAMAGKHAGVLGRADDQPLQRADPRRRNAGGQRHIGSLGAARGERDFARRRVGERRDIATRVLDQRPRGAPFGVHGGRVAAEVEGVQHGLTRLAPQRRGGVVIEIIAHMSRNEVADARRPAIFFLGAQSGGG